ncbi:16S rRNA (cytosine(1402)-N(4))-methyltransferase RsmH [Planctomycetes bacterium K23_9]|uniref:Ribosomal RNA small subunit methyltransferase H n=1 Tax=Stieleria marina TaxID=1930275 RepID=A0A517NLZ4_9BACT|nr:Ribosomal RNA small subunit methyltransferase H [Planctomycetes bacterium K23_9]
MPDSSESPETPSTHQRRVRYSGKNPRRFDQKYKEHGPDQDPAMIAKLLAAGKTPAGQHRPILVQEVLDHLVPQPGERGADVTFGYGGHSEALLNQMQGTGQLLALDVDADQLSKSEERLRALGHSEQSLTVVKSNYAGLAKVMGQLAWTDGLDFLLADLGLSSMQIDDPERGFTYKHDGPLDMRMDASRGASASKWIARCSSVDKLTRVLIDGGDEPNAVGIAEAIFAAREQAPIETTKQLRRIIQSVSPPGVSDKTLNSTIARTFQAIRIAVNNEFSALDSFLAQIPACLRPGGRVAILSFHSGEDRRVKHHFRDGFRSGIYQAVAGDVIRPTPKEISQNSRAASAKLRWAIRST